MLTARLTSLKLVSIGRKWFQHPGYKRWDGNSGCDIEQKASADRSRRSRRCRVRSCDGRPKCLGKAPSNLRGEDRHRGEQIGFHEEDLTIGSGERLRHIHGADQGSDEEQKRKAPLLDEGRSLWAFRINFILAI